VSPAAWRSPQTVVGALALLASLAGRWLDPPLFFAAWLAAWWFCLGMVLGAGANLRVHALTGGRWGRALAPAACALQRRLPWLLLLFLPLLAGIDVIYPWAATPAVWAAAIDHPAFQQAWFAPVFFGSRLGAYALVLWALSRGTAAAGVAGAAMAPGRAALGLIAYMLVTSLAAVDLLMSLVPAWTSTVFGWLAVAGQLSTGAAATIGLAALGAAGDAPGPMLPAQPPVWRDLGNLLLTVVLLQAYLQFMQFLIIWSGNLPREISWYLPRLRSGWSEVGLALVLGQLVLPVLALLWRSVKDAPRRLACVAGGVVAMQALGAAWMVVPSVQARGYAAWCWLPLVFAGMTLLLFGSLPAAFSLRRADADDLPHPRELAGA
jgi:hypothetical protein